MAGGAGAGGGGRLAGVVVDVMVFIAARDFICSTIVAFAGFGAISFLTMVVVAMVVRRSSYNFTSERYEGVGSHITSSPAA